MHLEPGQWIGGELRILRPLAAGGMGSVYVAEQRGTGKLRAVKTLHPAIAHDAAAVERFVREARVGASIASEHIVEVVAAGVDAPTGIPYIAMEYLEGDTLEAYVAANGPMSHADVALLFRQLSHALTAAHRHGIVHRDLKPQNVVLVYARRGDSPFTAKILDFGIAKLLAAAGTSGNSEVIGSPPWMAPEQLDAGTAITPATDVWSLGLIAFYLLTGRIYWRSATASIPALVTEIVLSPMEPASVRANELGCRAPMPPGFDAVFARAVARSAGERFRTVAELVDALDVVLRRQPASMATEMIATAVSPSARAPRFETTLRAAPSAEGQARPKEGGSSRSLKLLVALLATGFVLAILVAVGVVVYVRERHVAQTIERAAETLSTPSLSGGEAPSCMRLRTCCAAYNARRAFPADCNAQPTGSDADAEQRCSTRMDLLRARLTSIGMVVIPECTP